MERAFAFTVRRAFWAAGCIPAASLVVVARAGDKAQLSGKWNFNPNMSDDAGQKVASPSETANVLRMRSGAVTLPLRDRTPAATPRWGVDDRVPGVTFASVTFRLSEDHDQIYVKTRFESPSLAGPISIWRVYDRAKASTKQIVNSS